MKTQYDDIADAYARSGECIDKKYIYDPTFLTMLGDLSHKRVLDLACGSGHSTRLIKQHTRAGTVIGVDISEKQIELAKEIESQHPLEIHYKVDDVLHFDISDFAPFDIVTAAFLLHYSSTEDELFRMCRTIFLCLKHGGVFVGILPNPSAVMFTNPKYDVRVEVISGKPIDGEKRKVTYFCNGKALLSFYSYYWSKRTYEIALRSAGFMQIYWEQPIVSKEGIEKFEKGYWDDFLENPPVLGLKCA
jgi:SAM-dependent methyltransferase